MVLDFDVDVDGGMEMMYSDWAAAIQVVQRY